MDKDLEFLGSQQDGTDSGRKDEFVTPRWLLDPEEIEARQRKEEEDRIFRTNSGRVLRDPQGPPTYDYNFSPHQIPPSLTTSFSFDVDYYPDDRYLQPPAPDQSSYWRRQLPVPAVVRPDSGPSSTDDDYCEDDDFPTSANAGISSSRDGWPQTSHQQRGRYSDTQRQRPQPDASEPRFNNNKRMFSTGNAFKNNSKPSASASNSNGSQELKSKLRTFKKFLVVSSTDSDPTRVVNLLDEEEIGTLRSLYSKAMAIVRSAVTAVEEVSNNPPKKKTKRTTVVLDNAKLRALKVFLISSVSSESVNAEKCVTFMDKEEQMENLYFKLTALVTSRGTDRRDQDANDGGESDGADPSRGRWGEKRNGKLNNGKKNKSPQGKKTNSARKLTTKEVEDTGKKTINRKGQGSSKYERFSAEDTGFIPLGKKGISLANWKPGKVGEGEPNNNPERETSQTRTCPESTTNTNDVSHAESDAESNNYFASIPNITETEKAGKLESVREPSAPQEVINLDSSDSEPDRCTSTSSTQRSSRAMSENFGPLPYSDSVMGSVSLERISELKQRMVTGSEYNNVLAENDMVFNCSLGKIKLESDYRPEVPVKVENEVGTHDQEENGELNLSYQFAMEMSESGTTNEGNKDADAIIEIHNDSQTAEEDRGAFIEEITSAHDEQSQENGENEMGLEIISTASLYLMDGTPCSADSMDGVENQKL